MSNYAQRHSSGNLGLSSGPTGVSLEDPGSNVAEEVLEITTHGLGGLWTATNSDSLDELTNAGDSTAGEQVQGPYHGLVRYDEDKVEQYGADPG